MYETARDRENEIAVAEALCEKWGYKYIKLKPNYEIDFALLQFDDVKALLEVRCRNYSYDELNKLGGVMIACHKWMAFLKWKKELPDIGLVFALRLTDGIYAMISKSGYALENPDPLKIKLTGAAYPRDRWDVEPLILIPMNMFRKIVDAETIPTRSA